FRAFRAMHSFSKAFARVAVRYICFLPRMCPSPLSYTAPRPRTIAFTGRWISPSIGSFLHRPNHAMERTPKAFGVADLIDSLARLVDSFAPAQSPLPSRL